MYSSPSICFKADLLANSCLYSCITSFFSFVFTRLRDRSILSPEILNILQTIFLFGTTYARMNLIRPGAISEEIIVPFVLFGKWTKQIVFSTLSTVHSTRSPSLYSIKVSGIFVF